MGRRIFVIVSVIFIVTFSLCLVFKEPILLRIGDVLIHEDVLESTDGVLVLSGSMTGNRTSSGIKLYKEGLGKYLIFSGEESYFGVYSHELMKKFAMENGVPEKDIITGKIEGEISTWGEGVSNLKLMRSRGINSFILVTSKFHTYRSRLIYKQLIEESGYDMKILVYPAPDSRVPMNRWWEVRSGKVAVFLEYLKMVNLFVEHKLPSFS